MKDIFIWEDLVQNRGFYQVMITIGLIFLYLLFVRLVRKITKLRAARQNFHANRVLYVTKFLNFLMLVVFALAAALTWDVSFRGLAIYFASFFTVAGVALFANWSILSNVTASVLLYFYFPYKIGSRVTIMDGDNSVKGIVEDLSLFSIKIRTDKKDLVYYPNNLAIQKAILQNKRDTELVDDQ